MMDEETTKGIERVLDDEWLRCAHRFKLYFGPIMHCTKCGASTIASVDGKSKPIFPPHNDSRRESET